MDATIGNYKVRMEDTLLVLTHPAGISFDLTLEEAISLSDFINIYRQTISTEQQTTEEYVERDYKRESSL